MLLMGSLAAILMASRNCKPPRSLTFFKLARKYRLLKKKKMVVSIVKFSRINRKYYLTYSITSKLACPAQVAV